MKRALIVGIDDYPGATLTGCVADAKDMAVVLERHDGGSLNYSIRLVTSESEQIDRSRLRSLLAELFANSQDPDLLFFFAGHGAQSPWGAELVTQDFTEHSLGVSMNDVITLANNSPAKEVTIMLDCCFSGDIGNLPGLQSSGIALDFQLGRAVLRAGVTVLAASRATETAAESGGHGTFTRLLVQGLEGGAADHLGQVTALSLYAFASRGFGGWEQRPVFKSHVSQALSLRTCKPPIDPDLLRQLPNHFSSADARLRMSPSHEGTRPIPSGQIGTIEQQQFDYFKQLRNAGLLSTPDNKDLYFVAIESDEVFLTKIGRYFWNLAHDNLL